LLLLTLFFNNIEIFVGLLGSICVKASASFSIYCTHTSPVGEKREKKLLKKALNSQKRPGSRSAISKNVASGSAYNQSGSETLLNRKVG
jgi:hypothetical protein